MSNGWEIRGLTPPARREIDAMSETTITLENRDEAVLLFGSRDQNLRAIREALGVRLVARGDIVHVEGSEDQVGQAERVFQQLRNMVRQQGRLSRN